MIIKNWTSRTISEWFEFAIKLGIYTFFIQWSAKSAIENRSSFDVLMNLSNGEIYIITFLGWLLIMLIGIEMDLKKHKE